MRLRLNEVCPLHSSTSCCGRELLPKPKLIRIGIQRVEDPHHTRGYRELRSPGEMRKLLNRKIRQQAGICAICREEFTDYNDIVPYADVGIRHGMPTFRICRLDGSYQRPRNTSRYRSRHNPDNRIQASFSSASDPHGCTTSRLFSAWSVCSARKFVRLFISDYS